MARTDDDLIEIDDVDFVRKTSSAVMVRTTDSEEVWIPTSQITDSDPLVEDMDDLEEGTPITIEIPEWLAEDRGLV